MNLGWVGEIEGVDYLENVDLAKFTTIKLKATGDVALVTSVEALSRLLEKASSHKVKYHVLGWGANQVISSGKDVLFIKLKFFFDREMLKEPKSAYTLPASTPLNVLQSHAQKFGLKGWEVFTGIPASLGGAVYMNAGTALGEICEVLQDVQIMDSKGKIRTEKVTESSFGYRKNHITKEGDVIIAATLFHRGIDASIGEKIKNYLAFRKSTQPLASRNCGCVWKNYDENHKAGLFVDKSGLRNLAWGDLEVSDVHSNFYENKGEATFEDFSRLTDLLNEQLELHTGIRFELEAKVY